MLVSFALQRELKGCQQTQIKKKISKYCTLLIRFLVLMNKMLSRLPISSAQLKAGNNSEKLKNKIRQLLYSLCRSKKLTKTIYKNLIDIILTWKQFL